LAEFSRRATQLARFAFLCFARALLWIAAATPTLPVPGGYDALAVAVLAAISGVAAIYILYPFWCRSPVFHSYDLWRYACLRPFVIQPGPATMTKFVRLDAVRTVRFADLADADADAIARLLQGHQIHSDGVFGDITPSVMRSELCAAAAPCFVSLLREPGARPLDACMSARPVKLFFSMRCGDAVCEPAYLFDHICVRGPVRVAGAARALMHTHEYNQRTEVPELKLSLFRREGDLCAGVVPLVRYTSCTFRIPRVRPVSLPGGARVTEVTSQNRAEVSSAVDSSIMLSGGCEFAALSDEDVIFSVLRAKTMVAFCLKHGATVLAVYFFRDLRRQSEALGGGMAALIASVRNTGSDSLFFVGFLHALRALQGGRRKFAALTIDEIGNNIALCLRMRTLSAPEAEVDAAYYLYNGAHPRSPLPAARCFVLT